MSVTVSLDCNKGHNLRKLYKHSMHDWYIWVCMLHMFVSIRHGYVHDTQLHTKAWKIDGQCQEAIQPVNPQLLLACKHLLVDEALRKAHNQLCGHLHVWHNVDEPK